MAILHWIIRVLRKLFGVWVPLRGTSVVEVPDPEKPEDRFLAGLKFVIQRGWNPWAVYTHAWHETGGFKKVIGDNNFWGMKVPNEWHGKIVGDVPTHEEVGGKMVAVRGRFVDFATMGGAMSHYCDTIDRLYPHSFKHRDNPILYFGGLVSGQFQWATDSRYPASLERVYRNLLNHAGLAAKIKEVQNVASAV